MSNGSLKRSREDREDRDDVSLALLSCSWVIQSGVLKWRVARLDGSERLKLACSLDALFVFCTAESDIICDSGGL